MPKKPAVTPSPTIDLDWYLRILLFQSSHLLTKLWSRWLKKKKINLSGEAFAILHEINNFNGLPTPYSIAKSVIFEPAAVSAMIGRLENQGLVTKHKDLKEKHMVRVELTQNGRDLFENARQDIEAAGHDSMECLTDIEKEFLANILLKLRDHLLPQVYKQSKILVEYKINLK
ncbi:MarR family winged helix-turn-helix transcriptional regulator [Dehalogenimonas etheniformans]|uniref:MarR family winged helix-turn-helix transcriptional regulator n=1 Tax=Dehalogenimonas etheniformans TaxID=1536648 RepID=UPI000CB326BB|nr:MarR family transcriptional regulator [Dehalogenimonas etheniformans]